MTLRIEISKEAEAKLKERAAELGKETDAYASELVERAVAPMEPADDGKSLLELLEPLIEEARNLPRNPGPPLKGLSAEFAEGVAEKLRRQGLKL